MSNEKAAEDIFGDVNSGNMVSHNVDVSLKKTDPGWNDYVMSFFTEDEVIEGMPKVAGLRRVSELIMGPPIFSGPTQVFPSNEIDAPGRATVVFTVQFKHATYTDVADSWLGNTDDNFVIYNTAMASTRAEARALRKALGLHKAAYEEITKKDPSNVVRDSISKTTSTKTTSGETLEGLASSNQMSFINKLVVRANVDLDSVFIEFAVNPQRITKQEASNIIDTLNSYINGSLPIPENLRRVV